MSKKPLAEVTTELKSKFPEIEVSEKGALLVPVGQLVSFMRSLKDEYGFNFLTNVTAADYRQHFEVVYDVSIVGTADMIHIRTVIDRQKPVAPSMVPIWGGAIWQEREVYDLFGITFTDHPDLRRILLDDEWEGHPLRKDYQWEGGRD